VKRTAVLVVALATMLSPGSVASAAPSVPSESLAAIAGAKSAAVHIVVLADDPVASADGIGHDAGTRLDASAPAAVAHARDLRRRQLRVLERAGVPEVALLHQYTTVLNGFAARLSPSEAAAVNATPGVVAVIPDQIRRPVTDSTPGYLELDNPQGAWATGYTGEDVVVAVIDTGIWPEHPSFDPAGYGGPPAGFVPSGCEFGAEDFNSDDAGFACGGKLVTARAFGTALHGGDGAGLAAGEFLSARDADGHGSHTAAVAAGNGRVRASILDAEWGRVSGIAPRARLAVYKACWMTETGSACSTADLVAAIDQAVADGVDVINYSVGSGSAVFGADELAFLHAAAAGVMVAAAAGNGGPDASTIAAPATAPWVTTVGAATHGRGFQGLVTLGDGTELSGVSISGGVASTRLVSAADAGNVDCDPAVAFTVDVAGAVVVCARGGGLARVDKSRAVAEQGGAAMILVNAGEDESLEIDSHHLPTVHVPVAAREAIDAYLTAAEEAGETPTAELSGGAPVAGDGGVLAEFSARGPNSLSPDIVKPDLVAPGVGILAASTPDPIAGPANQLFAAMSGTSAASPHVAGVFALLAHAHPDWTPAMAKSALVTGARRDVYAPDGQTPAEPFEMGAGYLWPGPQVYQRGSAFNPGLVYDAGPADYTAFACGAGLGELWEPGTCEGLAESGLPTEAGDLNQPAIAVADLARTRTVTRTVTSVSDKTRAFTVEVREPPGFTVDVSPQTIALDPGESASFTVTITRERDDVGAWRYGTLSWATDGYRVTSPIAVRGADFSATEAVGGGGASGSTPVTVGFGYTGSYQAVPSTLAAPVTTEGSVSGADGDVNAALASGDGVTLHTIEVTEAAELVRVALGADQGDLDLYVFDPGGVFVAGSGSSGSAEAVELIPASAGAYTVAVHGFATGGETVGYRITSWVVDEAPEADEVATGAPRLGVARAPEAASIDAPAEVEVSWVDLAPDTLYLGVVTHVGPDGVLGRTVVTVDTGDTAPAGATPLAVRAPDDRSG
jgi:subtilisin family serine protease